METLVFETWDEATRYRSQLPPGQARNFKAGSCLHCGCVLAAIRLKDWSRVVKRRCPKCGKAGW